MKDIAGENEEREHKQDKAMKDLITDVIGLTPKEMFGEYALREWENLTPSDWAEIRKGEDNEKRSAFPFKFMMKSVKNKASRMLTEIEKSLGDGKGTVMTIIKSSASARGMYEIDPKNIDEGKGMATAAFRIYKAYLTLRAIASSKGAWRGEHTPDCPGNEAPVQGKECPVRGRQSLQGETELQVRRQGERGGPPTYPQPIAAGKREPRAAALGWKAVVHWQGEGRPYQES